MTKASSREKSSYVFDYAWEEERRRLRALETIWDGFSKENLASLGEIRGTRVLEVAAGAGSLASWLSEAVGDRGRVIATDLDTRFLTDIAAPNLEVWRHDITRDSLPAAEFDIVHCRLLLEHLPDRDRALQEMIGALRPDGQILIEEFDHASFLPDPSSPTQALYAWSAFMRAFERLAEARGIDLAYGRRLFGLLQELGLEDIRAQGRTVVERGGVPERALLHLSLNSMTRALIGEGEMDEAVLECLKTFLEDPASNWTSQLMVSASGRKPGSS